VGAPKGAPLTDGLGPRFDAALDLATVLHADQRRKGTDIPYVSHLLAVAAIVLEAGGDEDQTVAALLHDSVEDQPNRITVEALAEQFGPEVARIVEACSDTREAPKPPWKPRKEAYLVHLEHADHHVLTVSLADKLHNATCLRRDVERHGPAYLDRFNAGPADQLWYYRSLADVFERRLTGTPSEPFVADLREQVDRLTDLVTGTLL
jgi:(p)ppGpp synthase/HD superfamily hydrolase